MDNQDKILIRGLRVMGCHGVLPQEKINAQPYELDFTLFCDLSRAGRSDELSDSISYADVATKAAQLVRETDDQLLERLATRIAETLLSEFPAERVTVRLKKPQAPVAEEFDYMGVEITRSRGRLL